MPELSQKPGFLDGRVGSQKPHVARYQALPGNEEFCLSPRRRTLFV
ncbi:hypothetical protein QUA42_17380 [Microcoleus sp. Pol11C2]